MTDADVDTYEDLAIWNPHTSGFDAKVYQFRVSRSHSIVLHKLTDMLADMAFACQPPEQVAAKPHGPHGTSLILYVEADDCDRPMAREPGLLAGVEDIGKDETLVSIICYWPPMWGDEARELPSLIYKYWPDTTRFGDDAEYVDLPFSTERAEKYVIRERSKRRSARVSAMPIRLTRLPEISTVWLRTAVEKKLSLYDLDVLLTFRLIREAERGEGKDVTLDDQNQLFKIAEAAIKNYKTRARRHSA